MTNISEIIIQNKDKFRSLEFDLSKRENVSEYYNLYNISDEEMLLAYADRGRGSSRRMDMNATLITDRAIYTYPKHQGIAENNRIPLSNICSYVIYKDSRFVKFIDQDKNVEIYKIGMPSREGVGEELVMLLRQMQKSCIVSDKENRRLYENAVCGLLAQIRDSIKKYALLDDTYLKLLDIISTEADCSGEVYMLKAEHMYRLCDEGAYLNFISSIKESVSKETLEILKNPDELFFDRFIYNLSDSEDFVMSELLIKSYLNLKSKPNLSLNQAIILCYLCIRMEDEVYLEELLGIVGDVMDEEHLWSIKNLSVRLRNARMRKIYSKLLSQEEIFPTEVCYTDDLGLSVLHYALMTRNKNVVRKVLKMADWRTYKSPFPKDKIIDTVYDYNLLATLLFEDEDIIKEVYMHTSPQAQALVRSIKQMEVFFDISGQMAKKYPKKKYEYESKQKEYAVMKREMESELVMLSHANAVSLYEKAAIIRDIAHPFATYVLNLIDEKEGIFQRTARTVFEYKLIRYKNKFFVAESTKNIDLSYYEWANGVIVKKNVNEAASSNARDEYRENDRFTNPNFKKVFDERIKEQKERQRRNDTYYKNQVNIIVEEEQEGWFSKDAHYDIAVLKREYRLLVKQYHPDVTGSVTSATTLQKIMLERAQILEHMEAV